MVCFNIIFIGILYVPNLSGLPIVRMRLRNIYFRNKRLSALKLLVIKLSIDKEHGIVLPVWSLVCIFSPCLISSVLFRESIRL